MQALHVEVTPKYHLSRRGGKRPSSADDDKADSEAGKRVTLT